MTGKSDTNLSAEGHALAAQIHDTVNELNRLMRRAADRDRVCTELTMLEVTRLDGASYPHISSRCFHESN